MAGRSQKTQEPRESWGEKAQRQTLERREAQAQRAAEELRAAGVPDERALAGARAAVVAVDELRQNAAVFSLREFSRKFEKAAGEGWLDDPKWGEFRSLVARSVGMIPLAPSQADKDWASWGLVAHESAEKEMVDLAKRSDARHGLPSELVEAAIAARPKIAPEQAEAARASCLGDRAVVVTEGTAGAGKSFTLEVIKEVYQNAPEGVPGEGVGYDILGTALSWNAAKVLQESAKLDQAVALEGLLNDMDKARELGGSLFKRRTLVIVDEAGLVDTMKMRALLRHAAQAPHPVRVLLTGDSYQLNPVAGGNAMELIVDECGSARLDMIRRQERESHKAAVKHFCFGRAEQGLWTYWQQEALKMCPDAAHRRELAMRDYVRTLAAHPTDACLLLALKNTEVREINLRMRERLKAAGLLAGDEHEIEVNDGKGPHMARFCVGDRVVFRKNLREQPVFESKYEKLHEAGKAALEEGVKQRDAGLFSKALKSLAGGGGEPLGPEIRKGVFNRGSGIVLGIRKSPSGPQDRLVRVLLSEGGETEIDTADLRQKLTPSEERKAGERSERGVGMHHNFATTIYSSQGQTVHRVLILDSAMMNRRLAYVGMSRHKIECSVYADREDLTARKRERADRDLRYAWSPREKEQARRALAAESFADEDLWAEMALCWNKESKNPTVMQARKQMAEKRDRARREGAPTGRLRPAEGDDPDDEAQLAPGAENPIPAVRERSAAYGALVSQAKAAAPKKGFFQTLLGAKDEEVPDPTPPNFVDEPAESLDLPAWSSEPLAAHALKELDGVVWGRNRWGAPRLFALDAEGARVGRWTLGGRLKAGRDAPPALPNEKGSPWMVVQGPREALIAWSHFKEKWKAEPGRAPSIMMAPPEANLERAGEWLADGQAVHCAWSKRDPSSLEWARQTCQRLRELGYKAALYPKLDAAPAKAAQAKP